MKNATKARNIVKKFFDNVGGTKELDLLPIYRKSSVIFATYTEAGFACVTFKDSISDSDINNMLIALTDAGFVVCSSARLYEVINDSWTGFASSPEYAVGKTYAVLPPEQRYYFIRNA